MKATHAFTGLCQLAIFLIFLTKRFNPHSYLPRFSSMGFIRSAGSCTDSGSDVYRTSDKTLFITFTICGQEKTAGIGAVEHPLRQ